jgi:hypothetical protein
MDWAKFATSEPGFDFSRGSVGNKRGGVVAALTKKMGMEGLRPFVSEVVVPTHAKPVESVRFRFSHALDSMFVDRSLMKPYDLVINQPLSGKDPYALVICSTKFILVQAFKMLISIKSKTLRASF